MLKAISVWNIDDLQNVYLIQGSTLIKCDSSGKQLFSQSIKSIGNVAQIEPVNALKIAVFSEEQQSICLFDNTLTLNGECNYLDKFGIRNAKFIARSNRPNLFWIYDQFNSTLLLIDIISNKTIQKVDNIKGLILKGDEENEVEKIQVLMILPTSWCYFDQNPSPKASVVQQDILHTLVSVYFLIF